MGAVATWPEPDLEEAVEKLEWVYQHRGRRRSGGGKAGEAMRRGDVAGDGALGV